MWRENPVQGTKERPILVLRRKPNESIFINEDVVITVLSIRRKRVQLASMPRMKCPCIAPNCMKQ